MSSLAELLAGIPDRKNGPRCEAGAFLEQLAVEDPDGHAALVQLLDRSATPASRIAGVLREAGHAVSVNSLRRHRKRGTSDGCACA